MTRQLRQPLLVLACVCAAFTCAASLVVLMLSLAGHVEGDAAFGSKLLIRIAGFAVIAALAGHRLWRSPPTEAVANEIEKPPPHWPLVVLPCLLAAAIAFPRLGATPHVEPDEWHHLDVARNLAVHGLYASGNPEEGFVLFDDYDSVGPPVILPVAAAMRLAGPRLESARFVMAMFFVALAGVTFAFCAPVFGGWAAVCSSSLLIGAWGSAYLGRTLYGEVPAFMFLLLALIAGRTALQAKRSWIWGTVAGVCFGLAILSKYYLLMAVWPFFGALVWDRLTARRIRWQHVAASAIGVIAMVGTWSLIQTYADRNVSGAAGGQLSMYQHNLLFGLEGLQGTAGYLLAQPASTIALVAAMAFGLWLVQRHAADPTIAALWFFAGFQWYWWLFFNTGNLPRYSWYGWAAAAVFAGPLVALMIQVVTKQTSIERLTQPLAFACCAVTLLPAVILTAKEAQRAWQSDEMQPTRDLASYIASRPDDDRVATVFWPLERSIHFLSGRTIARVRESDAMDDYDVVLFNGNTAQWFPGHAAKRFGPYTAVTVRE